MTSVALQTHLPDGTAIGAKVEKTRSCRFLRQSQVFTVSLRRQSSGGKLPGVAPIPADISMPLARDKERWGRLRAVYFKGCEPIVRKPQPSGDHSVAAERQPS